MGVHRRLGDWLMSFLLFIGDLAGAGAATECDPDCSPYQEIVVRVFFFSPVVLVMLAVAALAVGFARRSFRKGRSRRLPS
jgi:hypothetical protein